MRECLEGALGKGLRSPGEGELSGRRGSAGGINEASLDGPARCDSRSVPSVRLVVWCAVGFNGPGVRGRLPTQRPRHCS